MLSISRLFNVVIGVSLIAITLLTADTSADGMLLLALVALPFFFAGLFDWKPVKFMADKLVESAGLLTSSKAIIKE